ncbi:lysylphosphatidylglycerol synthase transmembrane domain-containing protein [Leuconostocaceae bacterium ESL0958]|nr:lysylphosphatidylglycerol synthase transmembrane domain-containing protein [Leuconostocaceae bacterium ESL0958]
MNSRKNQISAVIVLFLTGLTVYYLSEELAGRQQQLKAALKVLDWRFLFLALSMMLLSLLMEALSIRALLSPADRRRAKFDTLLRVPLLNQLGIGLTPFQTGGQPAQLYGLTRAKIEGGRAMSVILMKFLVYQVVVVLFFLVGYAVAAPFIYQNVASTFANFIPFAIAIHAFVILGLLLVMFWPAFTLKVVDFADRLTRHFLPKKRVDRVFHYARTKVENFHYDAKRVLKSKKGLLAAIGYTVLQLVFFYMVPYFVIRAFGYSHINPGLILVMNIMIVMVISLFPIPGGVGGAELSFQLLFTPFVKNPATLILVILIWRLITYYFCLFAGILAYVLPTRVTTAAEEKHG